MKQQHVFFSCILSFLVCHFSYAAVNLGTEGNRLSFYGFLKPTYSFSTNAVSSFGYASSSANAWYRDNQVAATEALPGGGVIFSRTPRSHFNVGQSRVGVEIARERLRGTVELDFVDFDRSQATVALRPRLRVLGANLELTKNIQLFAGQDWDVISVAKPFTYNHVSLYFRSGNTGFMRPQLRVSFFTSSSETNAQKEIFSIAVGAAGINDATSNTSAVERGVVPTTGFRFNAIHSSKITAGLAGLFAPVRLENSSAENITRIAWLAKLYMEWEPLSDLAVHANAFTGRNAQSTGAVLSLASATAGGNQTEFGGFITLEYDFCKNWEMLLGSGIDHLIDSNLQDGQLIQNIAARLGLGYDLFEQTKLFFEATRFQSKYRWSGGSVISSNAYQAETGLIVNL